MRMHGRSILVVDPDSTILGLLDVALGTLGFVPRCARTTESAIEASTTSAPDLALIDMGVEGWRNLVAGIRTVNPKTQCYLVDSGAGESLSVEHLAKMGVHRCFPTPFTLQQLEKELIDGMGTSK